MGLLFASSPGDRIVSQMPLVRALAPCQMQSVLGQVAELVIELLKLGIPDKKITGVCFRPDFFFFFLLLLFFFHHPFSDAMRTWHFLQQSSKLWRM